jgi:zinc transporter
MSLDHERGPPTEHRDSEDPLGSAPAFVWAFRFHEDGTATPWPADQPARAHDGWLWLHLDLADQRVGAWLKTLKLPPSAVGLMLSRDRHQQIHTIESTIYGVFADHVRDLARASSEVGHLRFVMSDRMLISGRHHALAAAELARNRIEDGGCRLSCVPALLELIIEHVADGIERVADDLEVELDRVETALAAHGVPAERHNLAAARRTSVGLHRQLSGLRSAFHRFERYAASNLKPELQRAIAHLGPRLDGLDHTILEIQDRGRRLQEEVSALMVEMTNRHLLMLSVLTALFLPASLVASVFGMNVKGLPFIENESGFLWSMVILLVSSTAVYLLLRQRGMFRS